jgi:PTS system mannitol-specific IIC component
MIKKTDQAREDRIPSSLERLVNNFSAGILGGLLAIVGSLVIGPIVRAITSVLAAGVQFLVDQRLPPLADLFIEPGKILLLNNAINHGILAPLGVAEVQATGRSILFMLESNPGPGLGLLLTDWVAGQGLSKQSAPGAVIIHFLGGLHEVYFPCVLAHPIMILAMWAGGGQGGWAAPGRAAPDRAPGGGGAPVRQVGGRMRRAGRRSPGRRLTSAGQTALFLPVFSI